MAIREMEKAHLLRIDFILNDKLSRQKGGRSINLKVPYCAKLTSLACQ